MSAFMLSTFQTIALETCYCIAVLLLPSSLLLWTVNVVYRRRSFRDSGPLLLLNIALAVVIVVFMWSVNIGTLYIIVLVSYKLVLALLCLSSVLWLYVWAVDRFMHESRLPEAADVAADS
jgi:hypothetical protein